jgi:single-strand DNA-binding protein
MRTTQDGTRITNLAVAASETWRDRVSGERKGAHRMAPRRDLQRAPRRGCREISEERAQSLCRGALQTRKWTDNSGQECFTTEVVLRRFRGELTMLDGGSGAGGPPAMEGGYDEAMPAAASATSPLRPLRLGCARRLNDLDDDIPFQVGQVRQPPSAGRDQRYCRRVISQKRGVFRLTDQAEENRLNLCVINAVFPYSCNVDMRVRGWNQSQQGL